MAVDYRRGISILELLIYLPSHFLALYITYRHGFRNGYGWIYLFLFCLVRVIGACCSLATLTTTSASLFTAVAVCSSIGLSPLMLACEGFLSRANKSIRRSSARGVPSIPFHLLRITVIVALILCIVGYTSNKDTSSTTVLAANEKTKAGMALYILAWVLVTGLCLIITTMLKHIERGERRLVLVVGLSLPLILVRLIYSEISTFSSSERFKPLVGDVTVNLVMAVLEEIIVVIISLAVGFTLQKPPTTYTTTHENTVPMHPMPHATNYESSGSRDTAGSKLIKHIRKGGIIGEAVSFASNKYSKRGGGRG